MIYNVYIYIYTIYVHVQTALTVPLKFTALIIWAWIIMDFGTGKPTKLVWFERYFFCFLPLQADTVFGPKNLHIAAFSNSNQRKHGGFQGAGVYVYYRIYIYI